ncbi:MAG: glycosyl hydrolase, partial [Brevundimonas sp.]
MPSDPTSGGRRHRLPATALAALVVGAFALGVTTAPAGAAGAGPTDVDPGVNVVGSGSYLGTPVGQTPAGCPAVTSDPRSSLTDDAPAGPVPTNDWWSSLLFKKWECRTSAPLYAHPVAYQPTPAGLGLSTPRTAVLSGTPGGIGEFHFPYSQDVLVGVSGLDAPVVKVAGWSDWTVTPSWEGNGRSLRATIGHGLPFSWYHLTGGDAVLTATDRLDVWWRDAGAIGFTAAGHDYAAFAPDGSTWDLTATTARSGLAGSGFLSVVALPTSSSDSDDARVEAARAYQPYAFAEVTGTKASYDYDAGDAVVRTTYALATVPRQGTERRSVVALYPHQQQYVTATGGNRVSRTYVSPRGAMTAYTGVQAFTTSTPFTGVLPEIPAVATGSGAARTALETQLEQATAEALPIASSDTYWTGKALGKATRLAEIADQLGRTDLRDRLLGGVRDTLTDWFTATPGKAAHVFAYDRRWGTLIGYPASYGSDQDLNDHHFHYGYFVAAAATLARFDPQWARDYGGMVDLLVRDANGYDRADALFPYLRDFDVYAGHDWASGHGGFNAGNNQESSSEGMNYAGALLQWGEATGDTAARDAGAYLYATQAAAVQNYWFDGSGAIPAGFGHSTVGMIWGDGGAYATWFSGEPEMIQGINALPVTGSHLYLGLRPADVRANYAELVTANHGEPTVWQDILWSYLALGDPDAALAQLRGHPGYPVEEGETRAHTAHWITNLAALGALDASVHADHPLAAVFSS